MPIHIGIEQEPAVRPKYMRRKAYEELVRQLQTFEDRWEA